MKLLIAKNNKSRFTMKFKLIEDNEKFEDDLYTEYATNVYECRYINVFFENGSYEYEDVTRDGVVFEIEKKKYIFETKEDKIINKISLESEIDISSGNIFVKGVFAYQKDVENIDNVKKKFETNLRVEIINRLDKQIQQLITAKSSIDFQ